MPRVWRLCAQQQLFFHTTKKAPKPGKKPDPPVRDDLVKRIFAGAGIIESWWTEITEYRAAWILGIVCNTSDRRSARWLVQEP